MTLIKIIKWQKLDFLLNVHINVTLDHKTSHNDIHNIWKLKK